ncbi:nucleotide exchange factor GrpE [Mucisphaera sp.]|uniref:nucleotide exchange factor GrpE n=1 Tax=Mucisphaera sp. TaxID=2913024 RepID=UPI003D13C6D6
MDKNDPDQPSTNPAEEPLAENAEPTNEDTDGQPLDQEQADELSPLEQAERDRDAFEEKYLRTAADYQNFVRRSTANIESAREQAILSMARQLVGVMDTFDRALQVDPDKTTASDLLAGVGLVREELLKALAAMGVDRIEAKPGEEFDPSKHEALMRQPSDDYDSNHVVSQFQPGYTACGKTVRGAQVSVSE